MPCRPKQASVALCFRCQFVHPSHLHTFDLLRPAAYTYTHTAHHTAELALPFSFLSLPCLPFVLSTPNPLAITIALLRATHCTGQKLLPTLSRSFACLRRFRGRPCPHALPPRFSIFQLPTWTCRAGLQTYMNLRAMRWHPQLGKVEATVGERA